LIQCTARHPVAPIIFWTFSPTSQTFRFGTFPGGAGGATTAEELETEGISDPARAISHARRFLDAGAYMIMIESEGITESVQTWRTDVPAKIVQSLGLEKVMFEASDPEVFGWYIKNYGPEVNLFVDHSQIVQLQCLRCGIWGTKSLWGRVQTYRSSAE